MIVARRTLKTILRIACQFLWAVALVVGLSGFYLLLNYSQRSLFFSHSYIIIPAILALSSAAVLLVSGAIGCLASRKTSAFLQGLFVYLLVVVLCLEGTASVLAYYNSGKVDSELSAISAVFQNYTGSSQDPRSRSVDATQQELQCCGVQSYRDWLATPWFNRSREIRVPQSCCKSTFLSCNGTLEQPSELYADGCQVKLKEAIQFVLSLIIWSSLPVVLVEIVGFVTMALMMKEQPLREYHILDRD